ncbi:hypothetical protein L6452_16755 [Arctium lappa]|uniref:Uncharacterized protein n=1 Tax=Arctium lappa TaxID=4217 RepID=A0ACB9C1M8_ARCLA|nr:hypothetical protein L6452_16755 [Arctium lappa]
MGPFCFRLKPATEMSGTALFKGCIIVSSVNTSEIPFTSPSIPFLTFTLLVEGRLLLYLLLHLLFFNVCKVKFLYF